MSTAILEIQSHLTNARNELTKTGDYTESEDFFGAILRAIEDIGKAKEALNTLEYEERENLRGL